MVILSRYSGMIEGVNLPLTTESQATFSLEESKEGCDPVGEIVADDNPDINRHNSFIAKQPNNFNIPETAALPSSAFTAITAVSSTLSIAHTHPW